MANSGPFEHRCGLLQTPSSSSSSFSCVHRGRESDLWFVWITGLVVQMVLRDHESLDGFSSHSSPDGWRRYAVHGSAVHLTVKSERVLFLSSWWQCEGQRKVFHDLKARFAGASSSAALTDDETSNCPRCLSFHLYSFNVFSLCRALTDNRFWKAIKAQVTHNISLFPLPSSICSHSSFS